MTIKISKKEREIKISFNGFLFFKNYFERIFKTKKREKNEKVVNVLIVKINFVSAVFFAFFQVTKLRFNRQNCVVVIA